jgi:hypothetical protein
MNESQEQKSEAETNESQSSSSSSLPSAETQAESGTELVAGDPKAVSDSVAIAGSSAVGQFPITDKADKVKAPLTLEEKRKVWIRRIIGAILFFSILGSLALLAAAQAVTFLFKTILSP